MTSITQLIDRWNLDEGKPYKGSLINMDAHDAGEGIGCMCAQGQVLHLVGGWTPERLQRAAQEDADKETAKLLNISRAHAVLLRIVNDKTDGAPAIVFTDPGAVLGNQWSKLLDFWCHLDAMTSDQWAAARAAAGAASWYAARTAAALVRTAATAATSWDAAAASWKASEGAAGEGARAAAGASSEIQGAVLLLQNGKSLFFLPCFGFLSLEDIPPRPENYGLIGGTQ